MAVDLDKLIVQLSADYKQYENAMKRAVGVMNKQSREIEKRWAASSRNMNAISRGMARSIITPLAGISTVLSVREVARYADAWTVAQNKLNAASQMAGKQARSLEDLNKIADITRSGISETADLYAKLMRSTAGVAKSEMEVARATEIVNKAFKAGGAAASEQAAGILQLSQGLGSGLLQGDELRSVRENAPILAQAIADFYNVNIAGLKKLGEEGKITSEGVFRAILAAQPKIEAAFATTNATIQDGITRVNNAFTQYIGQTDSSLSASQRLVAGLTALADNFGNVADVTLKVAAIFAAGLLGRSTVRMLKDLGLAGVALTRFVSAARAATTLTGLAKAFGGLSVAAGPIGMVLGATAAGAMVIYANASSDAAEKTENLRAELESLGLYTRPVAENLKEAAQAVDDLANEERIRKIAALRAGLDALRGRGGVMASLFGDSGELGKIIREAEHGLDWFSRQFTEFGNQDSGALKQARNLAIAYREGDITAAQLLEKARAIETVDLSKAARKLVVELVDVAMLASGAETKLAALGAPIGLDEATAELQKMRDHLEWMRTSGHFDVEVINSIERIIDGFEKQDVSADDARKALEDLGKVNPDFSLVLAGVSAVISRLSDLRAEILATTGRLSLRPDGRPGGYAPDLGRFGNPYAAQEDEFKTGQWIAEQGRLNALSRERMDIEKRTAAIIKDAAKDGVNLTQAQAERLAAEQAAADARRQQEGRSGGGRGGKGRAVERYDDEILKEIEGLRAETAEIERLGFVYDRYGLSIDRARREAELLQILQNKGVPITEELRHSVRGLTDDWLAAAEANAKAKREYDDFQSAVEDYRGTMESAFVGLVTGAHSFRDALGMVIAKLAEMAASRAFATLWDGGMGRSTGGLLKAILGFSDGGPTPPGPKNRPVGIVHAGENVWSQDDIRRAGGMGVVEALRRNGGRIPGYEAGGVVGPPGMPPALPGIPKLSARGADRPRAVEINVNVEGANGDRHVIALVQQGVSEGLSQYDRTLPGRLSQINSNPRRR